MRVIKSETPDGFIFIDEELGHYVELLTHRYQEELEFFCKDLLEELFWYTSLRDKVKVKVELQ